ncbi:MAG: hypothetical protein IJM81_00135 [Prevotella sp.]|nr:hypothetical protein [Prevotella sp.]
MKKKSPYISPLAEIVSPASFLCGNSYGNDEGFIGLGSGELDASMGEAKTGSYEDFEGEGEPDIEISLWED